ncbi:hypothetical protein C3E88_01370 [Clostridium sp. Cult3]|nr:hypothetical protein [Clostridium sp. Cult3]
MMENRRESILDAATDVFSKYGFFGAKMEDIAKRAGIGKGTIYGYFDSKEALFYEMIKHGIEEYEKGLDRALDVDGTLEDKLYALCMFHGKYLSRYIDISQIIMTEKEVLSKELTWEIVDEKVQLFNRIRKAVEESIRRKELRQDIDPQLATTIIIGSIGQFYGQKICYEKENYKDINPKDLINTILEGLK